MTCRFVCVSRTWRSAYIGAGRVAEGVESGLSAAQLRPALLVRSLRGRAAQPRPAARRAQRDHRRDNDASGIGQRNALAAYDRWTAEGRSVQIKIPPNAGDDFNDVLTKRRTDAPALMSSTAMSRKCVGSSGATTPAPRPTRGPRAMALTAMGGASPIWACCGYEGGRRQRCRSRSSARLGNNGFSMRPSLRPARSIMSSRRCSQASRR